MARRRGGRDPNPYERWARERLEPILGTLREIDPGGGPRSLYDFEADLPGAGIAAIEVTGQVEAKRLEQASSAQRRFDSFTLPGSSLVWQIGLDPRARVNAIRPEDLRRVLHDMEAKGLHRAHNLGDYRDPFVERLTALGIESIYAFTAKPGREGTVQVGPGTYSGRGWNGAAIDEWLSSFLASPEGANKLGKLGASDAAERHLVIVLDLFSQAGMGISMSLSDQQEKGAAEDAIPSFAPPDPLTNVWLIPVVAAWEWLAWTRNGGWAVLAGSPVPMMGTWGTNAGLTHTAP
jgi:hypothetical protein